MGNFDPILLRDGSPDQVARAAEEMIREDLPGGRYIFNTGERVMCGAPAVNVAAAPGSGEARRATGAKVPAPATATPVTISRLRQPRSARTPKAIWRPLPVMLPTVAIRPAVAMSSCASVLNTGQMPEQQSTAECPPASASSVHHAVVAVRGESDAEGVATTTPSPTTVGGEAALRVRLPALRARGSSSSAQYAAGAGGSV